MLIFTNSLSFSLSLITGIKFLQFTAFASKPGTKKLSNNSARQNKAKEEENNKKINKYI